MKPELNTLLLLEEKEARIAELEAENSVLLKSAHDKSEECNGWCARVIQLQAENARFKEALVDMSKQKLSDELDDEQNFDADYQSAYNSLVKLARESLANKMVEEDANPTPHQICRWEKFGDEWKLLVEDRGHAASVWDNGTWHTWDRNGVGGENFIEKTVLRAKIEAAASAIAQGFI
jgi:hypothetical protein